MLKINHISFLIILFFIIPSSVIANNLLLAFSLEESINDAKRVTNGKLISAKTVEEQQQNVHHIRILTNNGKVKRFRYDERTGKRLNKDNNR